MIERNRQLSTVGSNYLFSEIAARRRALLSRAPTARVISLGIGNTTEPLTPGVTKALADAATALGTRSGYSGYGDEQGFASLRAEIASVMYGGARTAEEIFVSDGAKCDIARLQVLFGFQRKVAIQDPTYPAYVDASSLCGTANSPRDITLMPCRWERGFVPELPTTPVEVIYLCSPNNPTGTVLSREALTEVVEFALETKAVIIFDAAYSAFIQTPRIPRSIYEIPGAERCAIEVQSFSKSIGFTGVRLGWTVVPETLRYGDGTSIRADWNRICTTLFNGASNIVQQGARFALTPAGRGEERTLIGFYRENAALLRRAVEKSGARCWGGVDAPYLWVEVGGSSWEAFDLLLNEFHLVVTPGAGFGGCGEGFVRVSSFGSREQVEEGAARLTQALGAWRNGERKVS